MPCSRATSVGDAPGARLWAAIVCFCSVVQRRRRSPRGIKSIRRVGALLRLVVCALSVDAAVSAGVSSASLEGAQHTQPWGSHVGAAQRLPTQTLYFKNVCPIAPGIARLADRQQHGKLNSFRDLDVRVGYYAWSEQ